MTRLLLGISAGLAGLLLGGTAFSADLPGKFPGVTIDAKLIGGQQYEKLYERIPEWEKLTGAKVNILSKKNHFDLDKEIKSDIASNSITWCVGSNHTSFAPQYPGIYTDLAKLLPKEEIDAFVPANIAAGTLDGKLVMLPRAQFDVSALYYQKSLYQDEAKKKAYKAKYGEELAPPDTFDEMAQQAEFFASPPDFYGTQYAGKEEAINGRFYEMVIADGGEYLDKDGKPAFNSEAGVKALDWFVKLYKAKAVPAGTTNYLWDDLGQGFASGTVAINLDWPGWAGFFNDPKSSKVAGNVGVKVQPKGSSGKRSGWSGAHGFSVTENCANKEAAASLVWWLTNEDSQKLEAAAGPLPTRTKVWEWDLEQAKSDPYKTEVLQAFQEAAKNAFPVPQTPEWIEISNAVYPELQAAILGDKTSKQALDDAAAKATQILQDAGKL
ncbi:MULTISPECIES: sugar ABC transporter substrate-binding protein [unclassified Mesorhizobium]|uniref:ABC transporter substrate-binding protein n=1 Tax=unclassified Mesorhizobium TaxID=325217 RepID=UPI000FE403C1|nr:MULTISPECIES: sugar ABC transporter substrate-binding protein [unclassified Mesorhizobium]MDG4894333.1 sugar ABC transporter substrate-binding protein [Mesorhizobium sp. WSM4976]RWH72126.1 MAG: sugar ABC transporter substrate-binding protein [Mesorhizobium sp.]RWL33134.1 MAG: sugar ABC transporter substrate-binding protein [Mesorhizobium sp.]RWL34141.1 MAG: sugar ABC transporter substrate-binding protein [Mesorhizobium sp.]RWL40234.1 MAG: sugar ABC transporter substrate-binding protein [Mes